MPAVIGVITSPTGAVIRDILHRIRDRWPCRVILWPVVVQGEAAAAQVCGAIKGFNAMTPGGPVPRPDVLIVARGGGSVEDLWAFNDETLARTVAEGVIPLISAVGHETDTTLIDFVSDRRAPTPTAAAEMATPVLAELKALVSDLGARMHRCGGRVVDERRGRIEHADRALKRIPDLVRLAEQRFDIVSGRLGAGLAKNAAAHERDLVRVASRLSPCCCSGRSRCRRIDWTDWPCGWSPRSGGGWSGCPSGWRDFRSSTPRSTQTGRCSAASPASRGRTGPLSTPGPSLRPARRWPSPSATR